MFDRLGRIVPRLKFVFVALWVVAALFFGLYGPSLAKVGSADETSFLPHDAESLAARNLGRQAFPADAAPAQALIVFERSGGLTDADRAAIEGLRAWFGGTERPKEVQRYVTAEGTPSLASSYRSADKAVELARVDLSTASFLPETNAAIDSIRAHLHAAGVLPAGLSAQVTGQAGIGRDYLKAIQEGTDRTTIVTIVLVVLVLLLIYRAPLAALVPLLTIGAAFLVARGVLGFLAQEGWKLSSILDSFIVVLVFGVGTDYTIFLISRFREELTRNRYPDAVRLTVGRIGAVIAASAATVMIGLATMAVARFGMIQTTGPALAVTIFVTLLAGLTLTPSLLAIFGRRLFWPLHEHTRTSIEEDRGFWAALARRITARPGLISVVVLIGLAVPALAIGQLKQSFDVLKELPTAAESRQGFETLAAHLGQGQLMPLTVYVQAPGQDLSKPAELGRIRDLAAKMRLSDVQTVRSIVDPTGTGSVPDGLKPKLQLTAMARAYSAPPSGDLNSQLSDNSLAGVASSQAYVDGLGPAFPQLGGSSALSGAGADLKTIHDGLVQTRQSALVSNQLTAIVLRLQASGSSPGAGTATQLAALKAYLDELPTASGDVSSVPAYASAQQSLAALSGGDTAAYPQLLSSLRELSAWFAARPTPVYFNPTSIPGSADSQARAQQIAAARARLPGELDQLAAAVGPNDLYLAPASAASAGSSDSSGGTPADLLIAYDSPQRDVTRLSVTLASDPYGEQAFDSVHSLRSISSGEASAFGDGSRAYVGGATAEFTDVQTTISIDFRWVALYTILGILLVLVLLLRSLVAPVYLVLTVLLSYATSLSLSALFLQRALGQAGINYFIPLIVFVLLVALGSDYNIFLMARVREEAADRGVRGGMRIASARTGTVITSAGIILAGTFGALVSSPLQLLFQVGVAVALGVLIDTFIVRSLLVPAITAFIGEWTWWPWRSAPLAVAAAPAGQQLAPRQTFAFAPPPAPATAGVAGPAIAAVPSRGELPPGGEARQGGEAPLAGERPRDGEASRGGELSRAGGLPPSGELPEAPGRAPSHPLLRPRVAGHLVWIVPLAAAVGLGARYVAKRRGR